MSRSIVKVPFFYGWVVVAVAFVTMGVGVNARTAFSLFFPPILDEFGWERGLTAGRVLPSGSCLRRSSTLSRSCSWIAGARAWC